MAKEEKSVGEKFIDKTTENWYSKSGSNKIVFCKSVDDIIAGKAQSFEFIRRDNSVRQAVNAKNEAVERIKYALFTLANNDKILVRLRDELK